MRLNSLWHQSLRFLEAGVVFAFELAFLASAQQVNAQDLTWLLEQSPVVAGIMVHEFHGLPPFTAMAEIVANSKAEHNSSSARGTIEYQAGAIRWEAKLTDINSAQLTKNAKAAVRQLNGDQVLVLTSLDRGVNDIVLGGARAYLEDPLPELRMINWSDAGMEKIFDHSCRKVRFQAVRSDGATNQVICWRATEFKNVPLKIQVTESKEVFTVQLADIVFRSVPKARFEIPAGLSKYNSFEDLVQSVLVEKFRRRIGLE